MIVVPPQLGIIEGYFGRSWSWEDRHAVVNMLAPAGFAFFHYAPKGEARLRKDWQSLFPEDDFSVLLRFGAHCKSLGLRFGIGLTPYGAHLDFNRETKSALKAKLNQLDALGLDDLAILFDDMRGDFEDLAARQLEIIAFCTDHSKATRFFTCPSYYSDDPVLDRVFGARPAHYLQTLGKRLDKDIAVYWTGEEVCSAEYSVGHLGDVAEMLGRKVSLWDNYPVNDGPRMSQHLHLRAFTGRPSDLGQHVAHHAINPASQPMLGCIPALTLPMSYAQGGDYRYGSAFQIAAEQVAGPELAALLRADILTFQDGGLDRMNEERRGKLIEKYAKIDHACAREVVDWLNGGYAITGEMLQTQ